MVIFQNGYVFQFVFFFLFLHHNIISVHRVGTCAFYVKIYLYGSRKNDLAWGLTHQLFTWRRDVAFLMLISPLILHQATSSSPSSSSHSPSFLLLICLHLLLHFFLLFDLLMFSSTSFSYSSSYILFFFFFFFFFKL